MFGNKLNMNSKPIFGNTARKQAKAKMKKAKAQRNYLEKMDKMNKKMELAKKKQETRRASRESRLTSRNPITRTIAQREQMSEAKQQAKLRQLEAKTRTAELQPEIAAQNAKTESKVKIAKAKASGKFAGYSAIAAGASRLGQGLSDERNQDDDKNRNHEQKVVETITGSDDASGLEQGVL